MNHITLILADTIIVATLVVTKDEEGQVTEQHWAANVTDALTGKTETRQWDTKQLHAVVSLALGAGEEGYVYEGSVEHLYEVAEEAVKGFPPEVRPIP